jgi:hypothetical protein
MTIKQTTYGASVAAPNGTCCCYTVSPILGPIVLSDVSYWD